MTEVLQSPSHFPSPSSSSVSSCGGPNDGSHQHPLINTCSLGLEKEGERNREKEREDPLSVLELLVTAFRKSVIGCSVSGSEEFCSMEIGVPTNVRHVAHVTFDRFDGFLGLPDEFEPEVPRRAPSASANVFGVSTDSMQLSFDSRGNSVPTILLLMQRRLYAQGGLQAEGIFRINAENGQEEYVRDQLNRGVVPEDVDMHCLAGLIKAWFRELPTGILDSLSPEEVMQSQSEEECAQLVRQLPPTEYALLDWAVNLMADVAQLEHANKMNARNVAMVFAPNMTQMADPLTALMYAVQVMNFLKSLIMRTLREREDALVEPSPTSRMEPSDENEHHSPSHLITEDSSEGNKDEKDFFEEEPALESRPGRTQDDDPTTKNNSQNCLTPIENIIPGGSQPVIETFPREAVSQVNPMPDRCLWEVGSRAKRSNGLQENDFSCPNGNFCNSGSGQCCRLNLKTKKANELPMAWAAGPIEKTKGTRLADRINSRTGLIEAWR